MAITINGSGITSANIADGTIVNADVNDVAASKLTGALPAISGASLTNLPAGGITEADQWLLTANFSAGSQATLSTNVARSVTNGFNKLGTGMSFSSGVFTFPSTGYWNVEFVTQWGKDGTSRILANWIMATTDNSTYSTVANSITQIGSGQSGPNYNSLYNNYIFDVTNTTTHKVRFDVEASNSATLNGHSNYNYTYMTFIKLGDT